MIAGGTACNRRHAGRQPPYDAFWGARSAIVEDPDDDPAGLISPIETELGMAARTAPLPGT